MCKVILLQEFNAAKENSAQINKLEPKGNDSKLQNFFLILSYLSIMHLVLQLEAKIVGPVSRTTFSV